MPGCFIISHENVDNPRISNYTKVYILNIYALLEEITQCLRNGM